MRKLIYCAAIGLSILHVGCIDDDSIEQNSENLTPNEAMTQLNINDPSIWNTLSTQSIYAGDEEVKSASAATKEYPAADKYYFALFEDVPSLKSDYDFNDVMIRSKLYLEKEGKTQIGWLESILWNDGASPSVPTKLGLMFYEVKGKKYIPIPYEEIKVNGVQLSKEPWMADLKELAGKSGDEWTVKFEFTAKSNIWISYFIYSKHVDIGEGEEGWDQEYGYVMQAGFAAPETGEFDIPSRAFLTQNNLCWGMELETNDLAIPKENECFLDCFPEFQEWAESGGTKNKKWYEEPNSKFVEKYKGK